MTPTNRAPILAGLLAALAVAGPAGADALDRVSKNLEQGNTDKAWKICGNEMEAGDLQPGTGLFEACANAHLEALLQEHPEGPGFTVVEAHWQQWPGTSAGLRARELCADLLMVDGSPTVERAERVLRDYPETRTVESAYAFLWDKARTKGTSAAAQEFQSAYPNAPQLAEALEQENALVFADAQAVDTPAAWRDLLAAYPTHPQRDEIAERELEAAFREAQSAGTSDAWNHLLTSHPDHPRAEEANEQLRECAFQAAAAADTWAAWDGLLATFPEHPRFEEAATRMAAAAHGEAAPKVTDILSCVAGDEQGCRPSSFYKEYADEVTGFQALARAAEADKDRLARATIEFGRKPATRDDLLTRYLAEHGDLIRPTVPFSISNDAEASMQSHILAIDSAARLRDMLAGVDEASKRALPTVFELAGRVLSKKVMMEASFHSIDYSCEGGECTAFVCRTAGDEPIWKVVILLPPEAAADWKLTSAAFEQLQRERELEERRALEEQFGEGAWEALENLDAIRMAEKISHAETGALKAAPACPSELPGADPTIFDEDCSEAWTALGWTPDGPVLCRYSVSLGEQGTGFRAVAECDPEGDGEIQEFVTTLHEKAKPVGEGTD